MESSFAKQHLRDTEEIRCLKELLNQKEVYVCNLVQMLTQAQEDICAFSEKVKFLKATLEPLKVSYEDSEAKKKDYNSKVAQLQKDYEALKNKLTLHVS